MVRTRMSTSRITVMAEKRALVIEPHRECRSLFNDILAESGFAVTEAANAFEALAFLENGPYDIVATSLLSTSGPGLAVMESLRRAEPRPKVVILYTDLNSEKIAGHEALGYGELVAKAASPHLLPRLLQTA